MPSLYSKSNSISATISQGTDNSQLCLEEVVVKPNYHDENSDSDLSDLDLEDSDTFSIIQHGKPSLPLIHGSGPPTITSISKAGNYWESSQSYSYESQSSKLPLTIKTVHAEKRSYWKINFFIVLFPLLLCGIPIHLLLGGRCGSTNPKEWFKQIFRKDHPCFRLITVIFLIIGFCINGFFINMMGVLLNSLIIKGVVRSSIFEDVINILRIAPVVIPLNGVWIWGYAIRKLLKSFDRVTYPEIEIQWKLESKKMSLKKWKNGWRNMPSYRMRMLGIYLLIAFNQTTTILIKLENTKDWTDKAKIIDSWITFSVELLYNIMIPIYICLAWAIQFEFERLSLYIKSLIACKIQPDFVYLAQFKKYYKAVGNHVIAVNDICGIYYTWVIFFLYGSMYTEMYAVLEIIVMSIVKYIFGLTSDGSELPPVNVRMFVGNFFGGLSQVLLLLLPVWFCITANDQARHLHVRLNDFVSEPYVVLTPELYAKFRMLKNYIHARCETEKPALLNLPIVRMIPYCTCIYDWKTGYRVRH